MPTANTGSVDSQTPSGVKEFVFARSSVEQTTDITAGHHFKFNTVVASRGGSVVLDTTSAYVTTAATAALGRFTLKAGRTYRLRASVPYILGSGATGLLDVGFYDATLSANLPGTLSNLLVATTATNDMGGGSAEAVFTPTQDTLVELRIIVSTAMTAIGNTAANRLPSVFVETL